MSHLRLLIGTLVAVGFLAAQCSGKLCGEPCIKAYVAEKTPGLLKQILSSIERYPVEAQEAGEIRALDPS